MNPSRYFDVTITPSIVLYGSHGASGECVERILAKDRNAAIKQARKMMQNAADYGVSYSYRAKLSERQDH